MFPNIFNLSNEHFIISFIVKIILMLEPKKMQWKYRLLTCHYIIPDICLVQWPDNGIINPKHVANASER